MRRVGIIGCGAIGTLLAQAVDKGIVPCDELILYDLNIERTRKLKENLNVSVSIADSADDMIRLKPKVIVEAASQQAVKDYAANIVAADVDLIVMSVGALLEMDLKSPKIHVPSGAIGGLDAVSTAALVGIDEVLLTTRKNPKTLDSDSMKEKVVFEGGPAEAVKRFPREMNVAATLALHIDPCKLRVKVISDPHVKRNVHEILIKWRHGEMLMHFLNDPHPDNPKTSALAAWSAVDLLKRVLEKIA